MALIWVPDAKRAFVPARVVTKGKIVKIEYAEGAQPSDPGKTEFPEDSILDRYDMPRPCVPEMDDLEVLNMAYVLENIESLFEQTQNPKPGRGPNIIYSSVGPVLIALNPFENLPLYSPEWMHAYHDAGAYTVAAQKLGPHAYRTAEEAFSGLRRTKNQAIVICGESGAGKTVTNRKMLEYLCEVAKRDGDVASGKMAVGADPAKITQANELLECFGNATTTRNDNSSRFGKLTNLNFNPSDEYSVIGCGIQHYLLERSRITGAPNMERNYHIFYELCRGGDAAKYQLDENPEAYAYSKQGADIKNSFDDKEDFATLVAGMNAAGFTPEGRERVFEAVAAVLHLGNVKFTGDRDSSAVDGSSGDAMSKACALLGCDPASVGRAMTTKKVKIPGQGLVESPVGLAAAESQRDAVTKMIYSRTFDFVVTSIDAALSRRTVDGQAEAVIGLLDIFGFEDMQINGFEQMFINLTNERIQHLFNTIMFEREVKVYEDEGIITDFLEVPNNIEAVKLFVSPKNPRGIVQLLSDQCNMGQEDSKVDGAVFVSALNKAHAQHKKFIVCTPQITNEMAKKKGLIAKGGRGSAVDYKECFEIRHYAGVIMYTVQNFVPKSRDTLLDHLGAAMRTSSKPAVAGLFPENDEAGKSTVGQKFRDQLEVLAATLEKGEALFVRCIKSNERKVKSNLDRGMVMEQLVRGGVVAALEMRAAGLPDRMEYKTFCLEFGLLERGREKAKDSQARCQAVVRDLVGAEAEADHMFAFGHSRVFMKAGILSFLRACAKFKTNVYARRMQRMLSSSRIKKIDYAWAAFLAAEETAQTEGILPLSEKVRSALARGKAFVEPIWKALQDAKAAHGMNFDAINVVMEPHKDSLRRLRTTVDEVTQAVEAATRRKQEVDRALGRRIALAVETVLTLLDRVALVEQDVAEMADTADPAEVAQCTDACNATRGNIENLRDVRLPEFKSGGSPTSGPVDLDAEGDVADPAPQVGPLLEEAAKLTSAAEELAFVVLKVRREFAQAVTELEEARQAAVKSLEGLQEPARRCTSEGLTEIADIIDAAWRLSSEVDAILSAARDPDGYKSKAAALVETVRSAEEAVEKGKVELERRERERSERRKLLAQLDDMKTRLDTALARHGKLPLSDEALTRDGERILDLCRRVPALRGDADSDLAQWREKVDALDQDAVQVVVDMDLHVEEANKRRREEFGKRVNMFGNKASTKSPQERAKAEEEEEAQLDAEGFIEKQGMGEFKNALLEIEASIRTLKESNVSRSRVQHCANHFVKTNYGLQFKPESRT